MDEYTRFVEENGEARITDHSLNEDSLVFEVGGYRGATAQLIWDKYKCNVYVFEPVREFYTEIKDRMKGLSKVVVFPFGLSDRNGSEVIYLNGDGSSLYSDKKNDWETVELIKLDEFMRALNITHVDLININIEGEEYKLLPHMADNGLFPLFDNIQIQFHTFMPHAQEKRLNIQKQLSETHCLKFCYDFVWECWKIKSVL